MALKAGNIGTWHWRLHDSQREWSAESCSMLGYGIEEFEPLLPTWRERIHPDDRASAENALAQYLNHPEGFYRCEMRIRHRDGHWIWVQTFGSVVERDARGIPRSMIGVHFDISERKRHELQLQTDASQDLLTGLPNRSTLLGRMRAYMSDTERISARHCTVLFIGLDRFKQVNDMLGHAGGDEVITLIAERLQDLIRGGELGRALDPACQPVAARLGGDEFGVFLPNFESSKDALAMAIRLGALLARPYDIGGRPIYTTGCIGVVTSEKAEPSAESMLSDAETATREAKLRGRGQCILFDYPMRAHAIERAQTEIDLHLALERQEFFVVYQPVVALGRVSDSQGCAAVEALVRWQHPTRGLLGPAAFISVAEDSGQIGALGQLVLDTACRDFMGWRLSYGDQAPGLLAVNLSVAQLRQASLVQEVLTSLERYSMPAASLQLEVTESLAAQDPVAQARLRELKGIGVRLALDDFGTGYSSLACLHQMPVDTVKVDRSFVNEAERSEYHRALIEATVRVAHTLRMDVIAEGVETAAQARLVTILGCDKGQGYWYSKPLRSTALAAWMLDRQTAVATAFAKQSNAV